MRSTVAIWESLTCSSASSFQRISLAAGTWAHCRSSRCIVNVSIVIQSKAKHNYRYVCEREKLDFNYCFLSPIITETLLYACLPFLHFPINIHHLVQASFFKYRLTFQRDWCFGQRSNRWYRLDYCWINSCSIFKRYVHVHRGDLIQPNKATIVLLTGSIDLGAPSKSRLAGRIFPFETDLCCIVIGVRVVVAAVDPKKRK